ncbi:unnamed protein product, partial [Symbiodinium sp. CCMP2456]
ALEAKHPRHLHSGIPPELKTTLDKLVHMSSEDVGAERTAQLRKWVGRAVELRDTETALKERMPEHCAKVLKSKRLAVFKEMLEASGHGDETIVGDIAEGFKLSGPILVRVSTGQRGLRRGIIYSTRGSGDCELDEATFAATADELQRGWLFGPIAEKDLPEDAVVTRRFGIRQGGKCRPIDNYLESGVNSTASSEDTITVHSADVIAAALAYRIHHLRALRLHSQLHLRTWDLTKAYKNLALHLESIPDAFLAVWNPRRACTEIYGQLVLPFGARASVHGFCRTSLSVWSIGVVIFLLHWGVFFDDFIGCETPVLSKLFELCADGLFMILGWTTAADKGSDFDTIAKVLGLKIDLSECKLGTIRFANTDNRRDELVASLADILDAGFLSRKDGEKLRGRLQFAEQQISGKRAGLAYQELSRHVSKGGGKLDTSTRTALEFLADHVANSPPRCITDRSCYTWHLYVDASNDDDKAGIGGILLSESGSYIGHFSEYLSESARGTLNTSDSENPIFELECFAIWCGVWTWARLFRNTQ